MLTYTFVAGVLAILVGAAHSLFGEILIFRHLRSGGLVPTKNAPPLRERHVRILWASWHLATVLGWAFGVILLRLAMPGSATSLRVIVVDAAALAFLGGALLVLAGTRGRHPGWIGLLAVSALVWFGTHGTPSTPFALTVIGTDYAFQVPDSVPAGPAVLTFENRGRVPHEMVLARIRPDVSSREFADSLSRGARTMPLRATGSGVVFASPGTTNALVRVQVDFRRGERYAVWCQMVDSAGALKHNVLGMFKLVSVR